MSENKYTQVWAARWCRLPDDATPEMIGRAIHMGTDCGAWITFAGDGSIHVGSIVEGSDVEIEADPFVPYEGMTEEDVHWWLDGALEYVEREADQAWRAANGGRSDRIADRIDGYDRDDLGESPDY